MRVSALTSYNNMEWISSVTYAATNPGSDSSTVKSATIVTMVNTGTSASMATTTSFGASIYNINARDTGSSNGTITGGSGNANVDFNVASSSGALHLAINGATMLTINNAGLYAYGSINLPSGGGSIGGDSSNGGTVALNGTGRLTLAVGGSTYETFSGGTLYIYNGIVSTGGGQFTNLTATAAPATASTGQISYGGQVVSSSYCGSLSGSAGCIVVNIAGVNHYVPYW